MFGLEYQVDDDTLTYFSFDHGYRSGGLQLRANSATEVPTFDPETVDDYEIGLKTTMDLGSTTLRINVAAFYSDYQDIQRTISYIPIGQTILSTAVLNAAAATIKGGELELTFLPIDNLEISGFVGYTDAQYDSFPNPGGITLPIPGKPLADNEFAMLPETTASANVRYTLPLGAAGESALQAGWYTQTEMPISDINDPHGYIEGYDLFNASVEWNGVMGSPLDLRVYGRTSPTRNTRPVALRSGLPASCRTFSARPGPTGWRCAIASASEPPLRRATSRQAPARSRHISAMRARSMTRWPMSSARTPFAASAPDSYRRFMPSAITAMRQ